MLRLLVTFTMLISTWLSPPADHERTVAADLLPKDLARSVCTDTPLKMIFDEPVALGDHGRLRVHRADGAVVDTIDLSDPSGWRRVIGGARSDFGQLHWWNYQPVLVDGNTVSIFLHASLPPGRVYYVTVDRGFVQGKDGITIRDGWRFRTRQNPPPGTRRITVDASGGGDFCTVQGAVDVVPQHNRRQVSITIAPGTYREIVYVAPTKSRLTIRGADRERTVIAYPNNDRLNGDQAMADVPPAQSYCQRRVLPQPDRFNCWRSVVGVDADDVELNNLTIRNITPRGGSQAEAFRGNGDRITLRRVNLISFQDTLRLQGRAYVSQSYIEGDVDFVWGTGGVFVEDSELKAVSAGYYTQIRNVDGGPGNVFVNTTLTRAANVPDDSTYLGRIEVSRFPDSQVVFIDSEMDEHIRPVGWRISSPDDCAAADRLRFWEYHSTDLVGRPIDSSNRLSCSRQLDPAEAGRLRDPAYVLSGWDPQ